MPRADRHDPGLPWRRRTALRRTWLRRQSPRRVSVPSKASGMARVATAALGMASGQPERVIEALDPLVAAAPMLAALTFWPSHASALIETGQLERAQASVEGLESAAAARGLDMDCPAPRVAGPIGQGPRRARPGERVVHARAGPVRPR